MVCIGSLFCAEDELTVQRMIRRAAHNVLVFRVLKVVPATGLHQQDYCAATGWSLATVVP